MHRFQHKSMIFSPFIPLILFVKLKSSMILLQCDYRSSLENKIPLSYVLEDYSRFDLRNSLNILYGEDSVYAFTYQQNRIICSYFVQSFSKFNFSRDVYRGANCYVPFLGMYDHSISLGEMQDHK